MVYRWTAVPSATPGSTIASSPPLPTPPSPRPRASLATPPESPPNNTHTSPCETRKISASCAQPLRGQQDLSQRHVSPLEKLPYEILAMIVVPLDPTSQLALSWSCQFLYSSIPSLVPEVFAEMNKAAALDMLNIERWAYYTSRTLRGDRHARQMRGRQLRPLDLFFCCACEALLPPSRFERSRLVGMHGKAHGPGNDSNVNAHARMCIECGVWRGLQRFEKGVVIHYGHVELIGARGVKVFCRECKYLFEGNEKTTEFQRRMCTACIEEEQERKKRLDEWFTKTRADRKA